MGALDGEGMIMFRFLVTAILVPVLVVAGIAPPAQAANLDHDGPLDDMSFPQGRIQALAEDWQYLVPVRKPVGGWTPEVVVMPFVDETGVTYTARADLTQKTFTLLLGGYVLGTAPINDQDVADFRSTKIGDGTNCGLLCIALVGVFATAVLQGFGWLIDNEYDCNQAKNIAWAEQRGAQYQCERTRTPDGRPQQYRVIQNANHGNTCGTPHFGVCEPVR
jgi:hypothetical protein